jgi:hypothetical protein
MIEIAIKNLSSVLTDTQVRETIPAFQTQVSRDFASVWGIDAKLHFLEKGAALPGGAWQLNVFDNADEAGALGYHATTAKGLPLGKVFAKTTLDYGGLWSVTFSHELLEMLGDPGINLSVVDPARKRAWNFEMCDACEADDLGYEIDGVRVSDFVLRSYFLPDATLDKAHKRSFAGHLTKAFEIAPGGYMGFYDWLKNDWGSVDAQRSPAHGKTGSRSELRKVAHHERRLSTAE